MAGNHPNLTMRILIFCTAGRVIYDHESVETTQVYLHADMEIKKQVMDLTRPTSVPKDIYRPGDELLAYLDSL